MLGMGTQMQQQRQKGGSFFGALRRTSNKGPEPSTQRRVFSFLINFLT